MSEPTLTDERMLADLGAEVRSLVGSIWASLADLMFAPGRQVAAQFLTVAPVAECVRLADAWAVAGAIGLPVERLKAGLPAEDQLLLEIVTGVYPAAADRGSPLAPGRADLARLVDELTRGPEFCPAP